MWMNNSVVLRARRSAPHKTKVINRHVSIDARPGVPGFTDPYLVVNFGTGGEKNGSLMTIRVDPADYPILLESMCVSDPHAAITAMLEELKRRALPDEDHRP